MLAIQAARVFDGERMLDGGAVVLVDGGRIVGVERGGTPVPQGWPVRDLVDGTLLPGLIDGHVHLCADAGPAALDRLAGFSDAEVSATIEASLRTQLAAGVTTVRDLGDRHGAVLAWRANGVAGLPTIVASGPPITSVRGHCWSMGGEASGEGELRQAVHQRAERGADVVKLMASGGVLTPGTDTMRPQFTDGEVAAVVAEAHQLGLPVTAHAHALAAVRQSIRMGVDGIEHCTCVTSTGSHVNDEVLAALSASGVVVCATLGHDPTVVVPPAIVEMAERAGLSLAALQRGAGRLYRGGIRLVAGSDAGIGSVKPHGILPRTLYEYVQSGLPTTVALAAATSVAAGVCGLAGRKGRIQPGHDADLLLVDGDPMLDITVLNRPRAIYLAGQPVKLDN